MNKVTRTVAVALLAAQAGCTTVHTVQTPSTELAAGGPGRIHVIRADGAAVTILSPKVLDDTIFGFDAAGQQYILAVKDTKEIKARQVSMSRTGMLGGVVMVGVLVAAKFLIGTGTPPSVGEETEDSVVPLMSLFRLIVGK